MLITCRSNFSPCRSKLFPCRSNNEPNCKSLPLEYRSTKVAEPLLLRYPSSSRNLSKCVVHCRSVLFLARARGRHRCARVSRFRLPFYRKETKLLHGVCLSLCGTHQSVAVSSDISSSSAFVGTSLRQRRNSRVV